MRCYIGSVRRRGSVRIDSFTRTVLDVDGVRAFEKIEFRRWAGLATDYVNPAAYPGMIGGFSKGCLLAYYASDYNLLSNRNCIFLNEARKNG